MMRKIPDQRTSQFGMSL